MKPEVGRHLARGELLNDTAQHGQEQVLGMRPILTVLHSDDVLPPLVAVRQYIRVILPPVLNACGHDVGQHLLSAMHAVRESLVVVSECGGGVCG